jgi:hypothetical protein
MIPINKLKEIKNFKAREINSYPYVVKINKLLRDEEIEELLQLSKGNFEKSNIMIDGELIYNKQRTSSTAYLFEDGMPGKYSKNIERLIKRICYLVNCERSQLEIMCVRYKKGEYFGKHVDYFQEHEIDSSGQRIATFFVYLNTIDKGDGGETEFTKLKIKSRPKKGDAVFWYNKNFKTGEMIPETEHQGNPVTGDIMKYGLNIWIRDKSFY